MSMMVQHGIFLIACWTDPDHRFINAAQTVQHHARQLAWSCAPRDH
jgi:hypothetical protein